MHRTQELTWIIQNDLSRVLDPLEKALKKCLKDALSRTSCKLKLTCVSSSSGADALQGTVVLHRDTLCSMELLMKPFKAQSSIKASFRSDKQWKLQQVHDSLNHLQKANELLFTLKQAPNTSSPHGVVNILDEVIKHLIKCQSRLVLPSQLTLQALVGSGFTKMFTPQLPGDTLMNVFVVEDRLVVINYTVQQAHTQASLNPNKNTKLSSHQIAGRALFHKVGSLLEYSGTRYEISSANKCECPIPLLTNILQTASIAQLHCQNLKDKILKLKSGWTH